MAISPMIERTIVQTLISTDNHLAETPLGVTLTLNDHLLISSMCLDVLTPFPFSSALVGSLTRSQALARDAKAFLTLHKEFSQPLFKFFVPSQSKEYRGST